MVIYQVGQMLDADGKEIDGVLLTGSHEEIREAARMLYHTVELRDLGPSDLVDKSQLSLLGDGSP